MGPDASHRTEAAAAGVRHQTAVVRPLLVRLPSAFFKSALGGSSGVSHSFIVHFHSDVHAVCLWDDKGPAKIHQALKEDILDFIKQAQAVSFISFTSKVQIMNTGQL